MLKIDNDLYEYLRDNKSIPAPTPLEWDNIFYIPVYSDKNNKRLLIPFNYIVFGSNKKVDIPYINMDNECKSINNCILAKKGLCYSNNDLKRYTGANNKATLNYLFVELLSTNFMLFHRFISYLNYIDAGYLRFNMNNDFKNINSVKFLIELANNLKGYKIAGYTKRHDLIKDIKELNIPANLIINHPDIDNNFITTIDIKKFLTAGYYCTGYCRACLNCYKKDHKNIYCFLHGPLNKIDPIINTAKNRVFLIEFFNKWFKNSIHYKDHGIKEDDLLKNKGLLSSLNKYLRDNINQHFKFKNYADLFDFIKYYGGYNE